MYFLLLLILACLLSKGSTLSLQKRQGCEETLPLCSPSWNQTWYHHKHYTFAWNQNYTLFVNSYASTFDLHLLTQLTSHGTERTVKSWFNLTNNADLQVQVTDDWFPNSLPISNDTSHSHNNKTWTLYAIVLPHNAVLPPSIDFSTNSNELLLYGPYTQFYVVQLSPTPLIVNREKLSHKWIIAIIVIACVIVMIAIIISVWFYKNMQKTKIHNNNDNILPQQQQQQQQQSSILSTPDAMMIADTFRQVMSTSNLDKSRRNQVGEDLLRRELESEGTSVLQVERRTSSTKTKL